MKTAPENYMFAKHHCWAHKEEDIVTSGISDFAQQELGDIVYVELPVPGYRYDAGQCCATIESVKTASDVYMPISGVIKEVNKSLSDAPKVVNMEPYRKGWLFRIIPDCVEDLDKLDSAAVYERGIKSGEQE